EEMLSGLSAMRVVQLVKDVVIEPDLAAFGLAPPRRRYVLKSAGQNLPASPSKIIVTELHFGTNETDKIFARRADEWSVYAVSSAEVERLPSKSCQFRRRQIWNYTEQDVSGATIRQHGKTRQI